MLRERLRVKALGEWVGRAGGDQPHPAAAARVGRGAARACPPAAARAPTHHHRVPTTTLPPLWLLLATLMTRHHARDKRSCGAAASGEVHQRHRAPTKPPTLARAKWRCSFGQSWFTRGGGGGWGDVGVEIQLARGGGGGGGTKRGVVAERSSRNRAPRAPPVSGPPRYGAVFAFLMNESMASLRLA